MDILIHLFIHSQLGDHSAEAYVSRIKVALEYLQQEVSNDPKRLCFCLFLLVYSYQY